MAVEQVRIWRPAGEDRVLLMAGRTTRYAIEPRGAYVFGVTAGQPMLSRRGRERRVVAPGQLLAWDPSGPHSGSAVDRRPWTARLMMIELADLSAIAHDPECDILTDVVFPEPVIADPELTRRFLHLHTCLQGPASRLEQDEQLTEWLHDLIGRHASSRAASRPLTRRDDHALRVALEYLAAHPERNISLEELASTADIGKFRLIRVFREQTGLAPHALQLANRIRAARRLLDDGHTIAATAAATGFADQAHLHRHFQAALGWTPRQYQQRVRPSIPAHHDDT